MAVLVIQTGKQAGRRVRLPQVTVVIGRDEGCFLKLSSTDVSRRHCELKPVAGHWVIHDLGSQNGTLVNGQRITEETRLAIGDEILVGHMRFQWEGPKRPAAGESVLEDSIVDWLSERETSLPAVPGAGDTTILTKSDGDDTSTEIPVSATHIPEGPATTVKSSDSSGAAPGTTAPGSTSAVPAAPSRKLSLAEEAREVIQHFVENVGDGKPPALGAE